MPDLIKKKTKTKKQNKKAYSECYTWRNGRKV